jgi:hypothetical protein
VQIRLSLILHKAELGEQMHRGRDSKTLEQLHFVPTVQDSKCAYRKNNLEMSNSSLNKIVQKLSQKLF